MLWKRHTSHLIARSSLMNHPAMDISASSKEAFHLTSVINQKRDFIVNTKDHYRSLEGSSNHIFILLMRRDLSTSEANFSSKFEVV